MKQIQVLVTAEGEVTIKPIGFKGESCKQATASLEKALGAVVSDKPTAEMQEKEVNQNVDARR
jgi:hypothetical protein